MTLEVIAYTLIRYANEPNIFLKVLLYQYPVVLYFGFFCILIFQMSSLAPVFLNRFFVAYGMLAILFHISTGITISVYFFPAIPAILFFLIIAEALREKEEISSS